MTKEQSSGPGGSVFLLGGEHFRGKSEKEWKSKVAARNEPSTNNNIMMIMIMSGPNLPKASISVYVLAADSQDGICVGEHQN